MRFVTRIGAGIFGTAPTGIGFFAIIIECDRQLQQICVLRAL